MIQRDMWGPWSVLLEGADYEIHERRGRGRRHGLRQLRVWAGGAARVLAAGWSDEATWLHLAVGLAAHADLRGTRAEDPAETGALDPIGATP